MHFTIKNWLLPLALALPLAATAQEVPQDTLQAARQDTVVLTLEDALRIALDENVSVKVADKEIMRAKYAAA